MAVSSGRGTEEFLGSVTNVLTEETLEVGLRTLN